MKIKLVLFVILLLSFWGCFDVTDPNKAPIDPTDPDTFITADVNNNKTTTSGLAIKSGQLTAGEWRDLDSWQFWLNLMKDGGTWAKYKNMWGFYTERRYRVKVLNNNIPVNDVSVTLKNPSGSAVYIARTNVNGYAELFNSIFTSQQVYPLPLSISVTKDDVEIGRKEDINDLTNLDIVINATQTNLPESQIDVMFLLDTTESMGDEMSYLKAELKNIVLSSVIGEIEMRISGNYFKDEVGEFKASDNYKTRNYPFTTILDEMISQLSQEKADYGLDYPEAIDEALDDAVNKHDWSKSATTRLLFIITDAPPHEGDTYKNKIHSAVQKAAEKGIRIIPIMCSGSGAGYELNKSAEFALRFMSVSTGGTYVFLTDKSGIGDSHQQATVGQYSNDYLNKIIMKIIKRYSGIN